ncbi:MAG: WbqC family protein [Cellulosilyticaceae bacterium]
MIVSIHQPHYMPWMGYFYKLLSSDIFILLDNVQYSKNDFINRNLIKTANGTCYLTVPVNASITTSINDVSIPNDFWREKHIRTLEMNYKKAPFFYLYAEEIFNIIRTSSPLLLDLNTSLIKFFAKVLQCECTFVTASTLHSSEKKEALVIDLVSKVNGTVYLSGTGARAYQNPQHFLDKNIELLYCQYPTFSYPQLWGSFEPNLAIIDLLFNCGVTSRSLILNGF